MTTLPTDLRYSADHEWVDAADPATIGITQLAADRLGEIVFLELPEVGATVSIGVPFGEVESTKSVSELFGPVDGEVVEVNQAVVDEPSLLNDDAFDAWLIKVRVSAEGRLLSADEYAAENDLEQ